MYIILLSLLALLLGRYRTLFKIIASALAAILPIVVNVLIPQSVFPVLHVKSDTSQAALTMPIQLVARAAHDHHDDVTAQEKQEIESYLIFDWDEIAQNYMPYMSNPVTGTSLRSEDSSALEFLKAWVTIGLRHPMSYFNGFMCLESGWFTFDGHLEGNPKYLGERESGQTAVPMMMRPLTHMKANKDTYGKIAPIHSTTRRSDLIDQLYKGASNIPILNTLFYTATWTSIIPFFSLYYLWRRRKKPVYEDWVKPVPYWLAALTLAVYPVSLSTPDGQYNPTRYMSHTLLFPPLALGLLCTGQHQAMARTKSKSSSEETAFSGADAQ